MFMKKTMQMNFVDYRFYNETDNKKNANIATLCKFNNLNRIDFKEKVKENIKRRVDIYPILSSKIQESKIKNDFPYFVIDSNFNIDNHFFDYNVFSDEEFKKLVSYIIAKEIDLEKPLWEFHIINFKDITYVLRRCHHSMADGNQISLAIAFFDTFDQTKKIKSIYKVSRIRSYFNKIIKLVQKYYYIVCGFIIKSNKQNYIQEFNRKKIYKGNWRPKRNYTLEYDFTKIEMKQILNITKNEKISTLELNFLIATLCYQQILGEEVINKKDLISIFPRSYSKIKHYGNELITMNIDIPTSETSISKMIERIRLSFKSQDKIIQTSPHLYYAKALRSDPRISSSPKAFKFVSSINWNDRKKIPKYNKDFCPVATSTTYSNFDSLSSMTVFGEKLQESYPISMPINIPGSIGVAIAFRKEKDNMYISISTFKEIITPEEVKENIILAFERIKKHFSQNER